MKINRTVIRLVAAFGLPAVLLLLSSCKGRRGDNVVPTGETVEVVIPEEEPQSPSVPEDDNQSIAADTTHAASEI